MASRVSHCFWDSSRLWGYALTSSLSTADWGQEVSRRSCRDGCEGLCQHIAQTVSERWEIDSLLDEDKLLLPTDHFSPLPTVCQGPGPEMLGRRERREAFSDKEAILTWCLSHFSVEGKMCCIVPSSCPAHNSVSINGWLMLCWSCLHRHLIYFQYLLLQKVPLMGTSAFLDEFWAPQWQCSFCYF